jgi:hypothetical protein
MNRRAFDIRGNLADQLIRCLETPYSDVMEHHTVPASRHNAPRRSLRGPFSWHLFTSFAEAWSRELGLWATVIDHQIVLLTSANFSHNAENSNVEFRLRISNNGLATAIEKTMLSKHGSLYEFVQER